MTISAGVIVDGKFEVVKALGGGAFGQVLLAKQAGFDRLVAVKLLNDIDVDEEDKARFEREAKLLSLLKHPNIATFLGYGIWQGRAYTVLEYVPGETLGSKLSRGRVQMEEAVQLAKQLLRALSHAHSNGVVHRDLKPANILIDSNTQQPKIIDFGLARIDTTAEQRLTQEGVAIGTAAYMAPEQCIGAPIDERADLYSLGCILYECVCGQPPFVADETVAVLFKQLNEPVPQTEFAGTAFDDWLRTMLAKDAADRFYSADDALAALEQSHTVRRKRVRIKTPAWPLVPIAIGCAIAFGAMGAWKIYNDQKIQSAPNETAPEALRGASGDNLQQILAMPANRVRHVQIVRMAQDFAKAKHFKESVDLVVLDLPWCKEDSRYAAFQECLFGTVWAEEARDNKAAMKLIDEGIQLGNSLGKDDSSVRAQVSDLWIHRHVLATKEKNKSEALFAAKNALESALTLPHWSNRCETAANYYAVALFESQQYKGLQQLCETMAKMPNRRKDCDTAKTAAWWYRFCAVQLEKDARDSAETRELFVKAVEAAKDDEDYVEQANDLRLLSFHDAALRNYSLASEEMGQAAELMKSKRIKKVDGATINDVIREAHQLSAGRREPSK